MVCSLDTRTTPHKPTEKVKFSRKQNVVFLRFQKIQKQLMIFKTNYRNLKIAKLQSSMLLKTIKYFK